MPKEKRLTIAQVLEVLQEVQGKQVDAARKLQTSTATISRCLKENGYVPIVRYEKKERAS